MAHKHIRAAVLVAFAIGFTAVVATGCSSADATSNAEDLAACTSSTAWWKTQYDDSPGGDCEGATRDPKTKLPYYTNCGPAVTAMMRTALSCSASHVTAAEMRGLMNTYTPSSGCSPTGAYDWAELLNKENASNNWVGDDKAEYKVVNHCVESGSAADYTAADLAHDMASGAVTVAGVEGRCSGPLNSKGFCTSGFAPCGWNTRAGHALFVSAWNASTKKFTVYDPDSHKKNGVFTRCGNWKKGNYVAEWTEAELTAWSQGFDHANAHALCAVTGRGKQTTPPPPPPPPPPDNPTDQPTHATCGATSLHGFFNCGFESTMTNATPDTLYYCNGSDGIPVSSCLAGCSHSATDDHCTVPDSTAKFMGGSEYDYSLTGDWEYGYFKGTCSRGGRSQPHQAMTGLSMDNDIGGAPDKVLCEYDNAAKFSGTSCNVRRFELGDDRGTTSTGDWDYGNYKGECAANEYVAGVSQDTNTNAIHSILCCAGAPAHTSCSTVTVTPEDREAGHLATDWDYGFWKGECGAGRYVAGISTPTNGANPHALLCCDY